MSSLDPNFMHEIAKMPRGKGVLACIQCGRCTSSCPVAKVVEEHNPRKLLEMIMLGMRSEIVSTPLPWYCLSCFTCLDRCPQGGDVGETVLALRNLAVKEGNIPDGILIQAKNLFESGRVVPHSRMSSNRREKYGLGKGFDVDIEAVQKILKKTHFDKLIYRR